MPNVKGKGDTKIKRKPGRPATGKNPIFTFRMPPALREEMQRVADAEGVTLGKAVVKAIELGLAAIKRKKWTASTACAAIRACMQWQRRWWRRRKAPPDGLVEDQHATALPSTIANDEIQSAERTADDIVRDTADWLAERSNRLHGALSWLRALTISNIIVAISNIIISGRGFLPLKVANLFLWNIWPILFLARRLDGRPAKEASPSSTGLTIGIREYPNGCVM